MLKEALASTTAKLVAACVCPVVGATALTVSVPKVRSAVHRMTEPARPRPAARAKPRVRTAAAAAGATILCPQLSGIGPVIQPIGIDDLSDPAPPRMGVPDGAIGGGANRVPGRTVFAGLNPPSGSGGGGGGFVPADPGPDPDTGGEVPPAPAPEPTPDPSDVPSAVVPEPATWVQLVIGFALLGGIARLGSRWRRKRLA